MVVENTQILPLPTLPLRDDMILTYSDAGAYLRMPVRQLANLV